MYYGSLINSTQDSPIERYTPQKVDGKHRGIPMIVQRLLAFIALIALSPVLLLSILFIQCESKGSCFFSQIRVGRYGRHFKMYKFRSMYIPSDPKHKMPKAEDSDRSGVCQKYKKDPRITKVGGFIRKYSIDELPQLINIVKGDMALIGPRPGLSTEVDAYSSSEFGRVNGIPGISGLWQVSGRADTDFDTQVKLDKEYLKAQSIWLDIKIVLATFPCVISAKGAY